MARQGFKSVAIIHENSAFPLSAAQGAREWAERFGLKVVLMEGYAEGGADLPRLLRQAREQSAQALALAMYYDDCLTALKELGAMGWRSQALAMTTGPAAPDFYQRAGKAAENVFGATQWEPNRRIPFPGMARFIDEYAKRAGQAPSYHAASAYVGLSVMAQAATAVGSLDQKRLRDYIWGLDTITVIGRFKLEASGKQAGHTPFLIQWQDGKKEIVYPPRLLTAPPRF